MRPTHASQVHSYRGPRDIEAIRGFNCEQYQDLKRIGVGLDSRMVKHMQSGFKTAMDTMSMDAIQPLVTTASVTTPVQFLQYWLPGFVFVITAARKIDDLVGLMTAGQWEDEQIVQGILERTSDAVLYGDWTNVPLSSWNTNFNYRTVVRFEQGMKVGNLESARAARMLVDNAGMKREACAVSLEIERNTIGFFGFNNGDNNTYGFLNDPGLLPYTIVATGASSSTHWSTKSFLEIQRDILTAVQTLRTQSQDTIDPEKVNLTLAVSTDAVDYLATTSDFGISVRDWMKNAYPRIRVVSAPQLNDAHSSENVFYLYADKVEDESTDGGAVWLQVVPTKFQVQGVQQLSKAYEEDYSNATAGVMAKRPYAITRWYGI